jgi:hypothetical protein
MVAGGAELSIAKDHRFSMIKCGAASEVIANTGHFSPR